MIKVMPQMRQGRYIQGCKAFAEFEFDSPTSHGKSVNRLFSLSRPEEGASSALPRTGISKLAGDLSSRLLKADLGLV